MLSMSSQRVLSIRVTGPQLPVNSFQMAANYSSNVQISALEMLGACICAAGLEQYMYALCCSAG